MAFPRAPLQLTDDDDNDSTLSSPSSRRFQLRSSSISIWATKIPCQTFISTASTQGETSVRKKRKAKRSVTCEDVPPSDKVRQGLRLTVQDQTKTATYREQPALEGLRGYTRKSEENSRAGDQHEDAALSPSGTVRERHMRTVSQDDYLLARGANPRTGIVTPGDGLQNSADRHEILQARAAAVGESKWRQRGNQWISLGLDQPTPTGSPPKLDLEVSLPHQIPRKPVGSPPRSGCHDLGRSSSSSAPTPRQFKHAQPSDVGNKLPKAPEKPFLGRLRASEVAMVPNIDLRCPPMNSIQPLCPLSSQIGLEIPHGSRLPNRMPTPSERRGGDPSYPYLRYQKPQIPPRQYYLIQNLQATQKTNGHRTTLRHDVELVHPPFHPRSTRGKLSGPEDMVIQNARYQNHATGNIFTIPPNTIFTNTDTRTSSTSNDGFQNEPKTSENTSLPVNRTELREGPRPHMPDRSDEMTDVLKANPQKTVRHQSGQARMSDGATAPGHTPRQQSHLTGMNDDATDHVHIPTPSKSNKINYRVDSFEDKLCHMPGSIRTFDGLANAELDMRDDETASPAPVGGGGAECAITTPMQTTGSRECVAGLDESMLAGLEPLLIGLLARLLEMSSCIIQTLGKGLHLSYVYSETGEVKIEGKLVLDVLRSIVYTLILGHVAATLARVVQLAAKIGMGLVWVVQGVIWVLM
jgi:hypothetical protein